MLPRIIGRMQFLQVSASARQLQRIRDMSSGNRIHLVGFGRTRLRIAFSSHDKGDDDDGDGEDEDADVEATAMLRLMRLMRLMMRELLMPRMRSDIEGPLL